MMEEIRNIYIFLENSYGNVCFLRNRILNYWSIFKSFYLKAEDTCKSISLMIFGCAIVEGYLVDVVCFCTDRSFFNMKITTSVTKSSHQYRSPCYLHLPNFFLHIYSFTSIKSCCDHSFPQQIRPQTNYINLISCLIFPS